MIGAEALTLRRAAVDRDGALARMVAVVAGAGLVAVCAQVSIALPFTPVPVTGQTFAVVLVGASLGPLLGVTSLGLYLLIGIAGAPVYAHGAHGFAVITSASGGYLLGFLLAATVTGGLAERGWDRRFSSATSAMLAGNVVIYLVGLPWLSWKLDTNLEQTLELGLYPFVVGDLLKLYLAATLLPSAWRVAGRRDRLRPDIHLGEREDELASWMKSSRRHGR